MLYYYCRKFGDGLAVQPPKFATTPELASTDATAAIELDWWKKQRAHKDPKTTSAEEYAYFDRKIAKLEEVVPPAPKTWLERHDELVKEWFDGERALVDDLYPDAPGKAEDPVFGPLARGVVQAAKILGLVVAVFAFFIGLAYAVAWIL